MFELICDFRVWLIGFSWYKATGKPLEFVSINFLCCSLVWNRLEGEETVNENF